MRLTAVSQLDLTQSAPSKVGDAPRSDAARTSADAARTTADVVQSSSDVSQSAPPFSGEETIIKARRGWSPVDWRELLSHRELLFFLIWRDVKVKYKQAVLGVGWAVLVPVIQVLLFTVIGNAAGFSDFFAGPYVLYVYAGLLPWLFLSSAITNGGLSLVSQQNLLSKIYMPRLLIPASTVGTALVDFAISGVVFLVILAWYKFAFVSPTALLWLPPLVLLSIVMAHGMAFMLSALTINYRDVRFLIPFLAQILMWVSAAVYPPRIFEKYPQGMSLLDFNPIYGVICAFRSAILGQEWHVRALVVSIVFAVVMFVWGMYYFKKAERRFADIA